MARRKWVLIVAILIANIVAVIFGVRNAEHILSSLKRSYERWTVDKEWCQKTAEVGRVVVARIAEYERLHHRLPAALAELGDVPPPLAWRSGAPRVWVYQLVSESSSFLLYAHGVQGFGGSYDALFYSPMLTESLLELEDIDVFHFGDWHYVIGAEDLWRRLARSL
ncbi:MAG: hypothetical protein ACKVX7_02875 [Planctomycetota bacterium]